jgi:divalent metal cation (Fe/Co/Zn/Cd) transporter
VADRQLPIVSPDPFTPAEAESNRDTVTLPAAGERARLVARARLLAWGANAWHLIEFAVAVAAGAAASSTALIGFGADSLIEALAGFVVIWRFGRRRSDSEAAERRAQQLVAISFFVLAAYVVVGTLRTLAGGSHPQVSWPGIALAAFTAVTMPMLAMAKRRVGRKLDSAATVSEGSQNMLCAYLSVALLVGLGANALFGAWWADSLAALLIAGVAVREGIESWRGEACCEAC